MSARERHFLVYSQAPKKKLGAFWRRETTCASRAASSPVFSSVWDCVFIFWLGLSRNAPDGKKWGQKTGSEGPLEARRRACTPHRRSRRPHSPSKSPRPLPTSIRAETAAQGPRAGPPEFARDQPRDFPESLRQRLNCGLGAGLRRKGGRGFLRGLAAPRPRPKSEVTEGS